MSGDQSMPKEVFLLKKIRLSSNLWKAIQSDSFIAERYFQKLWERIGTTKVISVFNQKVLSEGHPKSFFLSLVFANRSSASYREDRVRSRVACWINEPSLCTEVVDFIERKASSQRFD